MRLDPDGYLNKDDPGELRLRPPLDRIHRVLVLPCGVGAIWLYLGWHMPLALVVLFCVCAAGEVGALSVEFGAQYVEWRQRGRITRALVKAELEAEAREYEPVAFDESSG